MRTLREPAAVIFSVAFAPVFVVVMGLILGNKPAPEFGGQGFLEANFTAFPGIVIAISSVVMVPIDMTTQRSAGVLIYANIKICVPKRLCISIDLIN